jgi:hypothetical protein
MFAALLADKQNFGEAYINVIELRSQHLMRHMVAAFLLGRSTYQPELKPHKTKIPVPVLQNDVLEKLALPIILREKDAYSDSFTQFTEALCADFDFEEAIKLADRMHTEAREDILLSPHATEIRRQAYLYIFEV